MNVTLIKLTLQLDCTFKLTLANLANRSPKSTLKETLAVSLESRAPLAAHVALCKYMNDRGEYEAFMIISTAVTVRKLADMIVGRTQTCLPKFQIVQLPLEYSRIQLFQLTIMTQQSNSF